MAFYLKDGKLAAVHNYIDVELYSVKADKALPAGSHNVTMAFVYDGAKEYGKGGTLKLLVDGKEAASGKIEKTTPFKYSLSENQDIGSDTGTPVTYDYTTPSKFEGALKEVKVELQP
ncbi:hypothetical protein [Ensifer sp. SSB1]|uniref:hypothetical protein n=1 Tax=Ensifer sp. SSB1 TaxID=2795385 RepID=UPI001A547831|nr:hypothetical protein [Ensifer sp. SSB1]MBK5568626.1 hypothetical protein [Ensifer sp. SSB1]